MTLLRVDSLDVRYGKIRAVVDLDLEVNEGEIVTLVGVNGAGKTSTIRAICGVVPAAGGRVEFDGRRLDRMRAHRRMALGIAHVPEGRQIFTNMTLMENILLGGYHRRDQQRMAHEVGDLMELFPSLAQRLDEQAFALSGGELQMLALVRGLMAKPRLLLLDEPALGLAPKLVRQVFGLIRALRERGMTILLVEQNVRQALAISDRGYVLDSGRVILSGPADELLGNDLVARTYLGVKHETTAGEGGTGR